MVLLLVFSDGIIRFLKRGKREGGLHHHTPSSTFDVASSRSSTQKTLLLPFSISSLLLCSWPLRSRYHFFIKNKLRIMRLILLRLWNKYIFLSNHSSYTSKARSIANWLELVAPTLFFQCCTFTLTLFFFWFWFFPHFNSLYSNFVSPLITLITP